MITEVIRFTHDLLKLFFNCNKVFKSMKTEIKDKFLNIL